MAVKEPSRSNPSRRPASLDTPPLPLLLPGRLPLLLLGRLPERLPLLPLLPGRLYARDALEGRLLLLLLLLLWPHSPPSLPPLPLPMLPPLPLVVGRLLGRLL